MDQNSQYVELNTFRDGSKKDMTCMWIKKGFHAKTSFRSAVILFVTDKNALSSTHVEKFIVSKILE